MSEDQYKGTRDSIEENRKQREDLAFEKKIKREIKYGRVGQDTKSKIANDSINEFVNQIISQKRASLNAINTISSGDRKSVV